MKKTIIWVVAVIVTMIYGGLAVGWVHRNDNPTRTADQTGLKTYLRSPTTGNSAADTITSLKTVALKQGPSQKTSAYCLCEG